MNPQIRRLGMVLVGLMISLMVSLSYWQVVAADRLNNDPRNTRKIVGVIVRGIYLSRTDLNTMLAKAEHDLNPQPDTARAGELKTTP